MLNACKIAVGSFTSTFQIKSVVAFTCRRTYANGRVITAYFNLVLPEISKCCSAARICLGERSRNICNVHQKYFSVKGKIGQKLLPIYSSLFSWIDVRYTCPLAYLERCLLSPFSL